MPICACIPADAYSSVKEALEKEGLTFFKDALTALGWFSDPPPVRNPTPLGEMIPFYLEDLDGATLLVPTNEVQVARTYTTRMLFGPFV